MNLSFLYQPHVLATTIIWNGSFPSVLVRTETILKDSISPMRNRFSVRKYSCILQCVLAEISVAYYVTSNSCLNSFSLLIDLLTGMTWLLLTYWNNPRRLFSPGRFFPMILCRFVRKIAPHVRVIWRFSYGQNISSLLLCVIISI